MNMKNCKKIFLDSEVIVKLTDEGFQTLCFDKTPEKVKKYYGKNLNLKT